MSRIVVFLLACATLLAVVLQATATQSNLTSPAGSVAFGAQVKVLPNGNLVVIDTKDPANGAA